VEAKYIFRQLLDGVGYMHSRHVIHRDLKPENILIVSSQPAPPPATGHLRDIKIADFGLSKVITDGSSIAKTFVGTPQYWAPEVLNVQRGGSYTQSADFWSLGAVLFVMLCGRYPFDGKKMPLEEQIQTAAYSMSSAVWQKVSEEAKDVVRGLLKVSPAERLSLDDCLQHPWLADGSGVPRSPQGPLVTEVSSGNPTSGTAPMVMYPSSTSELSGHSEGSVHIAQSLSQDREQPKRADSTGSPPQSQQRVQVDGTRSQQRVEVPSIHFGDNRAAGSGAGAVEQETIFCLNELLKLQVSIAGSLEMACLAFRHADTELSDAIRSTFYQARDLFSRAANVVSNYAEVAQQVGQLVLADLKLAVDEKEPGLAVSLLGMVKTWVADMKKDGEEIQCLYKGLQESVHGLIRRAQHAKTDADRRLAEAVQAAEAELAPALSPRTQQCLAIGPDEGGKPQQGSHDGALPPPLSFKGLQTVAGVGNEGAVTGGGAQSSTAGMGSSNPPAAFGGTSSTAATKGTLNVPFSMSVWTRQLFEQLSQAQEGSSTKGSPDKDIPMVDALARMPVSDADDETWKRDVLELLFMAPGIKPSQLPKVEQFNFGSEPRTAAEEVQSPTLKPKTGSEIRGDDALTGNGSTDSQGAGAAFAKPTGNLQESVIRFVPATEVSAAEKSAADAVTHSSASLLRALRELKRVDEILHGCSAFWANMDGTVQKLAQMKEHTETLVNFAANSKALKQRFDQRLDEYTNFWISLERVCRQYCMDHQAASKRMYEVIREVADAADVFDTTQSARMGMVLAMREKQRRHGGGVQY